MLEFRKKVVSTSLLDPREDFRHKTIETEIRYDPLTGETGRLAHFGMIKPQKEDFSAWDTPESHSLCPFCPENIEKVTPKYPSDLLPEGRLRKGQTTILPNISPYDQFSALAVMSTAHVVPLEKMTTALLKNAFGAGLEFLHRIFDLESAPPYQLIIWNYMPPSGGGLVHPHLQIISSSFQGNLFRKTLSKSKDYYRQFGQNFWQDLCATEKKQGERFAGRVGTGYWLTPFVPLGVLGEFMVVFPEIRTVFDLDDKTLDDLVEGMKRLFAYFQSVGIASYNMGLFFAPAGEAENYFSLHARFIPRTFLNLEQKPPDTNALQVVLHEPFTVIRPETQCAELKNFIGVSPKA
ncbi:MAG: hypothetical protein GX878_07585 [Firmicutes bacterium]|nr:hypothetical protein [Bacillota bacterium]